MQCASCDTVIPVGARFCSECGLELAVPDRAPAPIGGSGTRVETRGAMVYPRNPPLSPHLCWLSFVVVGLPHWVFGQVAKGFIWFFTGCILGLFSVFIGWFVVGIVACIDAYLLGKKLTRGEPVRKMEFFPS